MYATVICALRRFFRRWAWGLLFLPGLLTYPWQMNQLVRWSAGRNASQDVLASAFAKLVDPLLFYSKLSIAVGIFCFINLAAWMALNMAMPVLPDWAKGDYRKGPNGYPATPGFKGTFLALGPEWRMAIYFVGFALELFVAWGAVSAAFNIQ